VALDKVAGKGNVEIVKAVENGRLLKIPDEMTLRGG